MDKAMKEIKIHCPMCKEPRRQLVDEDGATLCLICGATQYTHPSRFIKEAK
jgi:uncharacterized Zn finger protein (UPF0148 family)